MHNARLNRAQAGNKTTRRNINNVRYADDTTLMAESKKELKSLLVKVKGNSERASCLKLNVQKKKRSWYQVPSIHGKQVGNQWKQWQTSFLGSKITAHSDCSHEIKRCLLLGRKATTNLDSVLKSRDITLLTEVRIIKSMVFFIPQFYTVVFIHTTGVVYGCDQFSSVQLLSRVWLCDPMDCSMPGFPIHHQLPELTQTHVHQVGDAINRLIFCHPLLLLPSILPRSRVFSNESVLHIRWPKYWSFSFSISPFNEYSGLISIRMDWFDLLAIQGTLKSLLQDHSSKASILQCSLSLQSNSIIHTRLLEKP